MKPSQNKPVVYAFIDSQNLNLGTSKIVTRNHKTVYQGWKLDFHKFYRYLVDKFRVDKAFLFIGFIDKNQDLYDALTQDGYTLIYKPTVEDNLGKAKGNVDAELVLHAAAIEFNNYQQAVIVSGDGDFRCLHEFLVNHHKLKSIIIPNRYSESSLLKAFQKYKTVLNREQSKLELKLPRSKHQGTKNGGRRS